MMNVPARILERRAELERRVKDGWAEIAAMENRIFGIDLCISAIEDAAEAPSAEAGAQGTASDGMSGAPEAETAPAGSVGASVMDMQREASAEFRDALAALKAHHATVAEPKKPRTPKRDIRGMVLAYVEGQAPTGETLKHIAMVLGLLPRAVESAVAYWQAKGRLTLADGVVRLAGDGGIDAPSTPPLTHNDPVEITGQGEAYRESEATIGAAAMYGLGVLAGEDDPVEHLVGFLERNPDSTMAEINVAGIPAVEVYRAERAGVVVAKPHGMYALPEAKAQQSEAAE